MFEKYLPAENSIRWIGGITVIICLATLWVFSFGYATTISWGTLQETITENFEAYTFQKGPFQFELTGQQYKVAEKYIASSIRPTPLLSAIYVYVAWFGICGLLAVCSFWKRFWFLLVAGLILLLINFLDLDSLGVFGFEGKIWTIITMVSTLLPAYYVHAFKPGLNLVNRWCIIMLPSTLVLMLLHISNNVFVDHFIANSTVSLAIGCLLFIILVAEEFMFLIVYLITQSKGGKHNEKHFMVFGLVYLVYLAFYYAKKAGFLQVNYEYLNPYYLVLISCLIALWSLKFKQEFYNKVCTKFTDVRYLLLVFCIIALSYLSHGFIRGNDPVYESMHYLIVYAHLGFGFMLFAYILVNFLTPLVQGLKVYRIVYTEQNFPYVTARLGGLVIMAAFFFYSDREPLKLILAGEYNYLGDIYENQDYGQLASEYYTQGSQYGWDNHYSNYRLGTFNFQKENYNEALYRFNRATKRHPSAFAFINTANVYQILQKSDEIHGLLRNAQTIFPASDQINNNLALLLGQRGLTREASALLAGVGDGQIIHKRNKWAIFNDSSRVLRDYTILDAGLRANILAQQGRSEQRLSIDSSLMTNDPNSLIYLINSLWYSQDKIPSAYINHHLENLIINNPIRKNLLHAEVHNLYQSGYVNESLRKMDILIQNVTRFEKGFYYDQMGMLALDQFAYQLAENFFKISMDFGYENAAFHQLISLLESGSWSSVNDQLEFMIARDSGHIVLQNDLQPVLSGQDDGSFVYAYYRHRDLSMGSLGIILSKLSSNEKASLWNKIMQDHLGKGNYEELIAIFEEIQSYLSMGSRASYQEKIDLIRSGTIDRLRTDNAFTEYVFTGIVKSSVYSESEKYEIIVEATQINPYSTVLQKEYCLAALRNGLFDYADAGMDRLSTLLAAREFLEFQKHFQALKRAQLSNNIWE